MKIDRSFAFPFFNLLARTIRPVLASKYWLPTMLLLCTLVYLPALFSGFFYR
jgi:hypothetical protein